MPQFLRAVDLRGKDSPSFRTLRNGRVRVNYGPVEDRGLKTTKQAKKIGARKQHGNIPISAASAQKRSGQTAAARKERIPEVTISQDGWLKHTCGRWLVPTEFTVGVPQKCFNCGKDFLPVSG